MEIIYLANDHIIELRNLKEKVGNTFVNDATVSVTVKTLAGAEVAGVVWPLTMSYVVSTNGLYRGILPYGMVLTEDVEYRAHIIATGANYHGEWNLPLLADTRTEA